MDFELHSRGAMKEPKMNVVVILNNKKNTRTGCFLKIDVTHLVLLH